MVPLKCIANWPLGAEIQSLWRSLSLVSCKYKKKIVINNLLYLQVHKNTHLYSEAQYFSSWHGNGHSRLFRRINRRLFKIWIRTMTLYEYANTKIENTTIQLDKSRSKNSVQGLKSQTSPLNLDLRLWTLFLDMLLSNWIMVFSIFAFAPVESEGLPKWLNLAP